MVAPILSHRTGARQLEERRTGPAWAMLGEMCLDPPRPVLCWVLRACDGPSTVKSLMRGRARRTQLSAVAGWQLTLSLQLLVVWAGTTRAAVPEVCPALRPCAVCSTLALGLTDAAHFQMPGLRTPRRLSTQSRGWTPWSREPLASLKTPVPGCPA